MQFLLMVIRREISFQEEVMGIFYFYLVLVVSSYSGGRMSKDCYFLASNSPLQASCMLILPIKPACKDCLGGLTLMLLVANLVNTK